MCSQEIINERNDGGKKCSYRNYELFCKVFGEKNVCLIMFTNDWTGSERNIIRLPAYRTIAHRAFNIMRGMFFTDAANERKVVDFIENNKIDIVLFERSMYGSLISRIKRRNLACKIWVFVHNIEKNYFENKVRHQSLAFYLPYLKIRESERRTFQYADYIIALTQRDAGLIREIYGRDSHLVLPMAFNDEFDSGRAPIGSFNVNELMFIGSLFPPNYDGIRWFVDNVMPELEAFHLTIAGKNFESKRKELERNNVSVIGSVESLDECYYGKNIMVMPIFYGDGMKVKTAEAMMYGKTILATNEALEGYETDGIDGIYRCNTKEEFVSAVKKASAPGSALFRAEVRGLFLSKYCLDNQIGECKKIWKQELGLN